MLRKGDIYRMKQKDIPCETISLNARHQNEEIVPLHCTIAH
jgi:hypothetical protein